MVIPLKPVLSLVKLSVKAIVDNFEKFMVSYHVNWSVMTSEKRPRFGPFMDRDSCVLILIIEELIKREELTYERLRVLLPEDTESLTCDENTRFSPFGCNTIDLVSKRCPSLKVLHCHYEYIRGECGVSIINLSLKESIPRLKLLQEINFCDTYIMHATISCIALNCPHLRELNLHRTNFSNFDVDLILREESVIKHSLTKLIIDETHVTTPSVVECLLQLRNLTYFQSDSTIQAAFLLFKRFRLNAKTSCRIPKFKTYFCKTQFLTPENHLIEGFVNWLKEKFPEVRHLSISSHEVDDEFVRCLIISWNHITQLELSCWGENYSGILLISAVISCQNLITLKLEQFLHVEIAILGKSLKKLEKLTLVNNTYKFLRIKKIKFENLKELKLILFENHFQHISELKYSHMPYEFLFSILSSENIERIFIYNQSRFTSTLVKDLLKLDCLRNLRELKVFKCPLEIDCIWELLNQTIPISEIVMGFCNKLEKHVTEISTYCKKNNLDISITLAQENPYYLRWMVQEAEVPS